MTICLECIGDCVKLANSVSTGELFILAKGALDCNLGHYSYRLIDLIEAILFGIKSTGFEIDVRS